MRRTIIFYRRCIELRNQMADAHDGITWEYLGYTPGWWESRLAEHALCFAGPPCSLHVSASQSVHCRCETRLLGNQCNFKVRLSNRIWRNFASRLYKIWVPENFKFPKFISSVSDFLYLSISFSKPLIANSYYSVVICCIMLLYSRHGSTWYPVCVWVSKVPPFCTQPVSTSKWVPNRTRVTWIRIRIIRGWLLVDFPDCDVLPS